MSEPMTNRCRTRVSFIEREKQNAGYYKTHLVSALCTSKRVLKSIFSMKLVTNLSASDNTADTENSSYLPLKSFTSELQTHQELLKTLKAVKLQRDLTYSRSLITKQLSEECQRKHLEHNEELKEKVGELTYKVNRKRMEIKRIQDHIQELEKERSAAKDKNTLQLPLTVDSLLVHTQTENLKAAIAKQTQTLQTTELQLEALENYQEELTGQLHKYKLLSKCPKVRNKHQSLAHSLNQILLSDNSESSVECIFPEKFQGSTAPKPALPKLDLSRIGRAHVPPPKLPTKQLAIKDFEQRCQEQALKAAAERDRVVALEHSNKQLVARLTGTANRGALTERPKEGCPRRALSSRVDYIKKASSGCQSVVSHDAFSSVHSNTFICHEDLESVLVDCFQDLID